MNKHPMAVEALEPSGDGRGALPEAAECRISPPCLDETGKKSTFWTNLKWLRSVCSRVRQRDGEPVAIGKQGEVCVMEDGSFDVWVVHPNRAQGLSGHTVNAVLRHLPSGMAVHRLTGEAWFQSTDRELVRRLLKPLGIRRKRKLSDATRAEAVRRLAAYRIAQQNDAS